MADGVKIIGLRERQKRLRSSKMLDAASALFAGQGYDATGIEAIAERADVAPATVYNYFETKPNLLMALALRHVQVAMPERRTFLKSLARGSLRRDPGLRAPPRRAGAAASVEGLLVRHSLRGVRRSGRAGEPHRGATEHPDQAALCAYGEDVSGAGTHRAFRRPRRPVGPDRRHHHLGFRPLRLGVRRDDRGSFGHGASRIFA